jgi:hypothetical protein
MLVLPVAILVLEPDGDKKPLECPTGAFRWYEHAGEEVHPVATTADD